MQVYNFISEISKYVVKYANKYNIKVHSPIIAQAILESARGTSELAKVNNYFGLKYKDGRCPTNNGFYYKVGSEQNADGTYTSTSMKWFTFENMEQCIIGYFDFINNARYENLKGVTDAKTYLENIKSDGYATSINYVDNLLNVIKTYDLTKYDKGETMSYLIALDDGHGMSTSGKRTPYIEELGRFVHENEFNNAVVGYLNLALQRCNLKTVLVAPTDADTSLASRVNTANSLKADLYISIHYNALDGVFDGNDPSGLSVYHYPTSVNGKKLATCIHKYLVNGTKQIDRGIKTAGFYVLKYTDMPAVLSENGFMDNKTEALLMVNVDYQKEVAEEHCQGICEYLGIEYVSPGVQVAESNQEMEILKEELAIANNKLAEIKKILE